MMHNVNKADIKYIVESKQYNALRVLILDMIDTVNQQSVLGNSEFETLHRAIRRDAVIETLNSLIDKLEKIAYDGRS